MSIASLKVPAEDPTGEDSRPARVAPPTEAPPTVTVEEQRPDSLEPTPEQLRYANVLEKGMRVGLLALLVTFPLYVFGIVGPRVPIEQVCECAKLDVHEYRAVAGIGTGWGWVSLLGYGDFLNFVGITLLAGTTVLCYVAVLPLLLKRHDTLYAILALLQILVLVLAASGVVAVGH